MNFQFLKYKTQSHLAIAFILIVLSLNCCINSEEYLKIKKDFADVEYKNTAIDLDSILNLMPEYAEIVNSIYDAGVGFNSNILLPTNKADFINNSKNTAIAFGMYLSNLAWVRQFERVQLCRDYLNEVKTLADKMAINDNEFNILVQDFESNLHNKGVLFEITDSLLVYGQKWFSESAIHSMTALFLGGFWLESLYLGIKDADINETQILKMIDYHFGVLEHIIFLFDFIDDDSIITRFKEDLKLLNENNQNPQKLKNDVIKVRDKTFKTFIS